MVILGIESSCDETAAAVVADGRHMMSNVIASQAQIHRAFGGVVPEIASRKHIEAIVPCVRAALEEAGITAADLDAVAVTRGPGLQGALLVGTSFAKAYAQTLGLPLLPVHHLAAHIAANFIAEPELEPPFVALVVSGGHSGLLEVHPDFSFSLLGRTRDDAAGEAFDKISRALGLGYPGGPLVSRAAEGGSAAAIRFPETRFSDRPLDFSFSGLKTAALNYLNQSGLQTSVTELDEGWVPEAVRDFCASYEQAVTGVLARHALEALEQTGLKTLALSGGVAANRRLRGLLREGCEKQGVRLIVPPPELCTDNAAMTAACAWFDLERGRRAGKPLPAAGTSLDMDVDASWHYVQASERAAGVNNG